ncbi:uncharacterized protein PHALS_13930 [Plasmopara halstedii]|uniref:Transmembrane protein n=1 Tax=Plasmopara halstedii TaxID=4781 RepID=A0A0P1A3X2_PLAHL|nr:uncharacterized protein PHALS_13930 [Plasmopara halstedii]CEG35178.1 hypothetical protein PHALS_13930 [Plasmopara halstedii]|eukprot:XP_024571547.1 hypothetical protein PHALS_13930 [Plasmopara halstedii]
MGFIQIVIFLRSNFSVNYGTSPNFSATLTAPIHKMEFSKSIGSVSQVKVSALRSTSLIDCVDDEVITTRCTTQSTFDQSQPGHSAAKKTLTAVWMFVGFVPLLLQTRSFFRLVTPHKISRTLVAPMSAAKLTSDVETLCPLVGLTIAGTWWNVAVTHYYELEKGRICHFVVPQYNIHGNYVLGAKQTPTDIDISSCKDNSYYFEYFFYHGSISYYAFYEEATGTFCANDNVGYVIVRGLGTYDGNGAKLANDVGDSTYRLSYWYGLFGFFWITYRTFMLRRSYISCKRFGRRCDLLQEPMQFQNCVVFVQESMRLSAHGARNYHRIVLIYFLIEGLMSDLFMLIAQDGLLAKVQYISLGYNLSGVLSILFEMVETMGWIRETPRVLIKRLLFNYETALLGEFACSAAMQHFLTGLNKSSLQRTRPIAEDVSYYVWSLVGHGIIVLGVVFVIASIRSVGAIISVRWLFGSFNLLWTSCCVDTAIGPRCKMILLSGYVWENGMLCYKAKTLKSFGIMKILEKNNNQAIVLHRLNWLTIPRDDLLTIGNINGNFVTHCDERSIVGVVSMIGRALGGPSDLDTTNSLAVVRVAVKQRRPEELLESN